MTCCPHGLLTFREIPFSCLIFFFFSLLSLLSLVSNSKLRLPGKGEGGKGKLITVVLSFERPGNSAPSRAIFPICSSGFAPLYCLSVKMIKIQQAWWVWLQLWSWNWLQNHHENLAGVWPVSIREALTSRLWQTFGGRSYFWVISQRGHCWNPSSSVLLCTCLSDSPSALLKM